MQIVVNTSDGYTHLLPAFQHQWERYYGVPYLVLCENDIPSFNVPFIRVSNPRWSNRWLHFIQYNANDIFLTVNEDYWLSHPVDTEAIDRAYAFMRQNPQVDKIDLSTDRMLHKHTGYNHEYILSDPNERYLTSLQAALWRKDYMARCLTPNENPWDFETYGSLRVAGNNTILGVRTPAMRYGQVVHARTGLYTYHLQDLDPTDVQELESKGLLPHGTSA